MDTDNTIGEAIATGLDEAGETLVINRSLNSVGVVYCMFDELMVLEQIMVF